MFSHTWTIINVLLVFASLFSGAYYYFPQWELQHYSLVLTSVLLVLAFLYPFTVTAHIILKRYNIGFLYSFGLALIAIAVVTRILGHLYYFQPNVFLGLWVAFLIPEAVNRFRLTRELLCRVKTYVVQDLVQMPGFGIFFALFFFLLISSLFRSGVGTFYPPVEFDVTLAHLVFPKAYIEAGGLEHTWWVRAPFIAQFVHMLYTAGLLWFESIGVRGDLYPSILACIFLFASVGLIVQHCKEKQTGIVALILVLLIPLNRWAMSTSYLDLPNTFFILLVITLLLQYYENPSRMKMFLLGLFCAAAFTVKTFAAIYLLPILGFGGLLFLVKKTSRERKNFFIDIAIALFPALCVVGVMLYKNYLVSGNPLFPFLIKPDPVNGYYWDEPSLKSLEYAIEHWKKEFTLGTLFTMWWSIASENHLYTDIGDYTVGKFWFVLMCVTPLLFIVDWMRTRKFDEMTLFLIFIAFVQVIAWYLSSPVYRYLAPQVMVLIFAFLMVLKKYQRARYYIISPLVVLSLFCLGPTQTSAISPPPVTRKGAKNFLNSYFGYFAAERHIHQTAGSDDVVYTLLSEASLLYMPRAHIGDWFGHSHYGHVFNKSKDEVREFFSSRSVDMVLYTNGAQGGIDKVLSTYHECLIETFKNGFSAVYKINKDDPSCYDSSIAVLPVVEHMVDVTGNILLPFWPKR